MTREAAEAFRPPPDPDEAREAAALDRRSYAFVGIVLGAALLGVARGLGVAGGVFEGASGLLVTFSYLTWVLSDQQIELRGHVSALLLLVALIPVVGPLLYLIAVRPPGLAFVLWLLLVAASAGSFVVFAWLIGWLLPG